MLYLIQVLGNRITEMTNYLLLSGTSYFIHTLDSVCLQIGHAILLLLQACEGHLYNQLIWHIMPLDPPLLR
jgi:hypothetical protein